MGLLHSNGMITINRVATPASKDDAIVFHLYFLNIKNKIKGAIAILWGFVSRIKKKNIIESLGFEIKMKISDNRIIEA